VSTALRETPAIATSQIHRSASRRNFFRGGQISGLHGDESPPATGLYLTGGQGGLTPQQEVADPQKVMQNLFGGSILTP